MRITALLGGRMDDPLRINTKKMGISQAFLEILEHRYNRPKIWRKQENVRD